MATSIIITLMFAGFFAALDNRHCGIQQSKHAIYLPIYVQV